MFELEPSGADSEIEPAAGHQVERRCHIRRDARVAVGVAVDQRADPRAPGVLAESSKGSPSLETRPARIRNEVRIEVVEGPQRVVSPLICLLPEVAKLAPFDGLLSGLDSKTDRMLAHLFPPCGSAPP